MSKTTKAVAAQGVLTRRPAVGALPYPTPSLPLRRAMESALRVAWKRITKGSSVYRKQLRAASEVQITTVLVEQLNAMRTDPNTPVPGFTGSLFETVVRGGEVTNFDGSALEKRPDMVFRTIGMPTGTNSTHCGLFVECKLIDATHPVRLYGLHGVRRFVAGEYAWTMTCGLMVAYVGSSATITADLDPLLRKKKKRYGTTAFPSVRADDVKSDPPVFTSTHTRTWWFPDGQPNPGPIELAHLWLPL